MTDLVSIIALTLGGALGYAAAWFLMKSKVASAAVKTNAELQPQISALTERVRAKDEELTKLQTEFRGAQAQTSRLLSQIQDECAARAAAEEKSVRVPALESQLQSSQAEAGNHREQNAKLLETIRTLEEKLSVERSQIEVLQQKFQKEFEAVANKLLIENAGRFTRQSGESLEKLLTPFKDELKGFKQKLENSQVEAATHSALLKDQISRIGTEAANLSKALRGDVKVLGNWGENMLDQILDKSGLQTGLHYRRQRSAKDAGGDQRFLDVIVELPENNHLIIDSKVSVKCYEDYVNSTDEVLRATCLENHVACIRKHFRELGAKRYQDIHGINTPDFVLMYVPIEAAFFVAVAHEPGLFSEALEKNVVLITNSTLLATLRTVSNVWRLADQQKNAQEIAERGGKLYDKFVGFIGDLQEVGETLNKSRAAWEEATKKLHTGAGNLVRQAEQLRSLGVKAVKTLPPQFVDQAASSEAPTIALSGPLPPPSLTVSSARP